MKFALCILLTASAQFAAAGPSSTDNLNYAVTLKDTLTVKQARHCVKTICGLAVKQGNGFCEHHFFIGVVSANLDSNAAEKVSRMSCVLSVDEEIDVDANPSVGRRN